MAARTISNSGGTRAWSDTASWVEAAVPTASDDVVATATSGALTIGAAAACRSIDLTGYTNTLTHGAFTLSIGTTTSQVSKVALSFPTTGWTYTLSDVINSAISFIGTSADTTTANFGGKTTGNLTVNMGTTSTIQLLTNAFNTGATATVTLTQGGFDVNGRTCSWGLFVSNNSNVRVFTLGAANITMTGAGGSNAPWLLTTTVNLTFNANTSTITFGTSNANFASAALTYNNIVFASGFGGYVINAIGLITCNNLTFIGDANKTRSLVVGGTVGNVTVTGTLTITGNSTTNRILFASNTLGTQRIITAAAVSFANVDFRDISGLGAASWNLSAITGNSGDCGGNANITFTTPATQTATMSLSKNWSDVTIWTSRVPLPQDNVLLSGITGGTLTTDMPRAGKDIDWTGATGTPTWAISSTSFEFYGSLTMITAMTTSGNTGKTISMLARSNVTLNSFNVDFRENFEIRTFGATVTLTSNNWRQTASAASALTVTTGTFNANNLNVTCGIFSSNNANTRTINMGSGIWTLTGTLTIWNTGTTTNLTVNANTSTVSITDTSVTDKTIALVSATHLWNVSVTATGTGKVIFNSNTNIDNILTINAPKTIQFSNVPSTLTLASLIATGSAGNLITFITATGGTAVTMNNTGGVWTCDWLSLKDCAGTGNSKYAGANSTNVSGNSGWIFRARPSIYRPGGTSSPFVV